MRQKHFSRLWKKLVRNVPDFFWRKPMFAPQKGSYTGNRAQARKSKQMNKTITYLFKRPLKRQTKQMRRGER